MATQIQLRRGTAAAWTAANTVLAQGELAIETDTSQLKAGDGVTAWNSLGYVPTNPFISNQANAAYAQANAAYAAANAADTVADNAYAEANTAFNQANSAYAQANAAFNQANTGYSQANTAYAQANSAFAQANLAYTTANAALNTATYLANGTLILANANLNFNNTATIDVIAQANGTTQANVSFVYAPQFRVVNSNSAFQLSDAFGTVYKNTATINVAFIPTIANVPFTPGQFIRIIVGSGSGNLVIVPNTNVTIHVANASVTGNQNLIANTVATLMLLEPIGNVWMLSRTQ